MFSIILLGTTVIRAQANFHKAPVFSFSPTSPNYIRSWSTSTTEAPLLNRTPNYLWPIGSRSMVPRLKNTCTLSDLYRYCAQAWRQDDDGDCFVDPISPADTDFLEMLKKDNGKKSNFYLCANKKGSRAELR